MEPFTSFFQARRSGPLRGRQAGQRAAGGGGGRWGGRWTVGGAGGGGRPSAPALIPPCVFVLLPSLGDQLLMLELL